MNIACAIMEAGGGREPRRRKGVFKDERMRSAGTLRGAFQSAQRELWKGSPFTLSHSSGELSFLTGQSS